MEYQKISNLLGEDGKPKSYQTRKWIEINYDAQGNYSVNSQIKFKTKMTMSDLCDYVEAYVLVKGTISVAGAGAARAVAVTFKNCAPFTICISEINNTQVDNARCDNADVQSPRVQRRLRQREG